MHYCNTRSSSMPSSARSNHTSDRSREQDPPTPVKNMTLYRAPISLVTISTPRTVRAVASSVLPIAHGQSTNAKHTSQQRRHASILGSLSDNPGAYNKRIRRGRGPASGKGKTSGRGHKGQKQHGKVPAGFNGGQTPLEVVKGRKGFLNP